MGERLGEQWNRRWRMLAACCAVAALGAAVLLGELGQDRSGDRVRADARRVHCLSDQRRAELVRVAVRLGAAAPGSTGAAVRPLRDGRPGAPLTVDAWSREDQAGFDRACAPLAVLTGTKALQDPPPGPPLWRRVLTNPVFTLVLGGLLTAVTSASAARAVRRQTLADQLNTAAAEYLKAAQDVRLARTWENVPDAAALEGRRVELGAAILRAGLRDSDRRNLGGLLDRTHRELIGAGFQKAASEEAVRRLEHALSQAVRGAPVPAVEGRP
ncbi:hypothetical protein AB0C74_32420 [Spirillospora sp. NPDC048832]